MTIVQEIAQLEKDVNSFRDLEISVGHKFREISITLEGRLVVAGNFFRVRDWMNGFMEGKKS